jgi:hypothetical protein
LFDYDPANTKQYGMKVADPVFGYWIKE